MVASCSDAGLIGSDLRSDARADVPDARVEAGSFGLDAALRTDASTVDRVSEDRASASDAIAVSDRAAIDAVVDAPRDVALDAARDVGVDGAPEAASDAARDGAIEGDGEVRDAGGSPWIPGPLTLSPLPPRAEQLPLPGGGVGDPVFTSNNPEVFEGDGLLFGTGRASVVRGGARFPMARFGVYLHHLNRSGGTKVVSLIVTNPNASSVTVSARGSGYTQTETGGLGLGMSPDFRVSDEWIQSRPTTVLSGAALEPSRPLLVWQRSVNDGAEIDGRFRIEASAPVLAYLVVTSTTDLNEVIRQSLVDAPGIIARSGTPPPPFGREAGVYEFDTWRGAIPVEVPASPARSRVGWMVNTATGSGHAQVQAFRALMSYDDSAREAVGMYGNVYDLDVQLRCAASVGGSCRVRLVFLSHLTVRISRYWDGVALVDGVRTVIRHVPEAPGTVLGEYTLAGGASRTVRFRAMVPGLASIPQALYAETF
jgi:hypothetical protein